MKELKDSGTREAFDTGAVRDAQQGKGRFDLLPYHAIERVAQVMEAGARKYEDRNWELGIPTHRFMDSGLRHAMKHLAGRRDEDHIAQACWNLLCLMETEHRIDEGRLPVSLRTLPAGEDETPPSGGRVGQIPRPDYLETACDTSDISARN